YLNCQRRKLKARRNIGGSRVWNDQKSSQGQGLRLHHRGRRRRRSFLSPLGVVAQGLFRRPARGQRSTVRRPFGREGPAGIQLAIALTPRPISLIARKRTSASST